MMQKTATFSPDRKYRYTLHRIWNESKPLLAFIMCNPSTADENILDPTVTLCFNFAGKWGYGGLVVGNIFALRSTDPKGLLGVSDPIGPDNNNAIRDIAEQAGTIFAAWGSFPVLGQIMKQRAEAVKNLLHDFDLYALRINKDGSPKHPLYTKGDIEPVLFYSAYTRFGEYDRR